MNMDMGSNGTAAMGAMKMYLHFTGGNNLFFESWLPSSPGAIAGACIALAALSIFERWVSAMRAIMEAHWQRRVFIVMSEKAKANICHEAEIDSEDQFKKATDTSMISLRNPSTRIIPPFIPGNDIPRGVMCAFQAFLAYALMLAVMSFQAAFVISIILGLGIGEAMFGRFCAGHAHHTH